MAILSMFIAFASLSAFAGVDSRGLSKEQEAQIQIQIEQLKKSGGTVSETTVVSEADKWADVAAKLSGAASTLIADTAAKLSVTANEFAKTPLGMLLVAILVFHFFGGAVIHVFAGAIWFAVFIPVWIHYFNRMCMVESIEYDANGKKKLLRYASLSDGNVAGYRLVMLLVLALVTVVGLVITFNW